MLKESHFADSNLQEQSDHRRIVLIFTEGIQIMLKKKGMHRDF